MTEKEARNPKFLDKLIRYALDHKDLAVPDKRHELYQAQMWALGMLMALENEGYKIIKEEK